MRERPGPGASSSSPCCSGGFPREGEPSRRERGGRRGGGASEMLRPGRRRSVRISPHGMMRHLERIFDPCMVRSQLRNHTLQCCIAADVLKPGGPFPRAAPVLFLSRSYTNLAANNPQKLQPHLGPACLFQLAKVNSHHINVPLNAWNTKCRLITCMSA
jgi:hypothetical protein